jgi:hypothetical protein
MHEIVEDTRKTFDEIKTQTESAINPQDKSTAPDNKQ